MTVAEKAKLGWQCPECFGVRVTTAPRVPHDDYKYQCEECGNQWSVKAKEGNPQ